MTPTFIDFSVAPIGQARTARDSLYAELLEELYWWISDEAKLKRWLDDVATQNFERNFAFRFLEIKCPDFFLCELYDFKAASQRVARLERQLCKAK